MTDRHVKNSFFFLQLTMQKINVLNLISTFSELISTVFYGMKPTGTVSNEMCGSDATSILISMFIIIIIIFSYQKRAVVSTTA